MYDWPRDRPYLYQVILVLAVWCWWVQFPCIITKVNVWSRPFYQIVFMYVTLKLLDGVWLVIERLVCGYFGPTPHCGGRDFLPTFHYTSVCHFQEISPWFNQHSIGTANDRPLRFNAQPLSGSHRRSKLFSLVWFRLSLFVPNFYIHHLDSTSITMIPLSRGWGRLLINFFVFQTSESYICVLIL